MLQERFMPLFFRCLVTVIISVLLASTGFAEDKSSLAPVRRAPAVTATNGIYTLTVEDAAAGAGTFTVATGASHPNPGQNVLYGGASGSPWSTYLTVRSYSSSTDYVSRTGAPTSSFAVQNLSGFSPSVTPLGTTGFRTAWSVTGSDTLGVVQDTVIEGTSLADSRVRVTTTVTNNGATSVQIGMRYQWDWMIGASDTTYIRRHNPNDAAFSGTFFESAPAGFEYYEQTDAISGGTFSIFGTTNGPASLSPAPTPPTRFNYSSWGSAYGNAWTFTVSGGNVDSAVCYFWGDAPANALTIAPGQSYAVTQYLTTAEQSIAQATPTTIPTMNEWGMIIFMAFSGLGSLYFLKRRRHTL